MKQSAIAVAPAARAASTAAMHRAPRRGGGPRGRHGPGARDPEAALARDERRRLVRLEVVELPADLARHLEDVAEALGGQQRDDGAGPLEQRVRGGRRRVDDHRQLARARSRRVAPRRSIRSANAIERSGRRRRHLVRPDRAGRIVDQDGVGERAPDVDPDPVAAASPGSALMPAARSRARPPPARPARSGVGLDPLGLALRRIAVAAAPADLHREALAARRAGR